MKPASPLTASLLARKGQAAPAMGPRSVAHTLPQETKDRHDQSGQPETGGIAAENTDNNATDGGPGIHAETLAKLEDALIEKALERGMAHAGDDAIPADAGRRNTRARPKAQVGQGERIAMTVRLSHDEHLKLKVFAAHTKMSSQHIFKAALESFMTKSAPKSLKSTCLCFGEKK